MAHKQLFFRSEAREKVMRGAAALADAVRVTLGPKSKCVLIGKNGADRLFAMTEEPKPERQTALDAA